MGWLNCLMLWDLSDVFDDGKSVLMVCGSWAGVPPTTVANQASELELECPWSWSWLWLQVSGHETSAVVYLWESSTTSRGHQVYLRGPPSVYLDHKTLV